MDSTASESLDLDSEARIELAVAYFRAHPEQSIRELSKTFGFPMVSTACNIHLKSMHIEQIFGVCRTEFECKMGSLIRRLCM